MAGVSRLQYSSEIRLLRVMCSGRVDLEFILRAFSNGEDGVLIGGCRLNECNYTTHGNYDALSNTYLCKKLMEHIGLNPERLGIEFMTSGDGNLLAEVVNNFTRKVKELGPLGEAEGINADELKLKLEAARKLVPYIKLVERERLRVPMKSEEEYTKFWNSDEVNELFNDLIADKLAISQIIALLQERPLSAGEISEVLGIDPSEVARHLNVSAMQGLIRFDENQNHITVAQG